MSVIWLIGKKMEATGLTDILMEAWLVESGTTGRIMSGENSRAMACHKAVLDALQRLLVEAFLESIVKGSSTRKPKNWKAFLQNEENKQQLCKLMHTVWSTDRPTTSGDSDSLLIRVKEGQAYDINTQIEITELQSD